MIDEHQLLASKLLILLGILVAISGLEPELFALRGRLGDELALLLCAT